MPKTTVQLIADGDSEAIAERNAKNVEAKKPKVKEMFESLGEQKGTVVRDISGLNMTTPEKPYRENLSANERQEKDLLIQLINKYMAGFDQVQDKKAVPAKLRRQKLIDLKSFFPELEDMSCKDSIEWLQGKNDAPIDYDLLVRLEDQYIEISP